jgi:hypothetical protein
METLTKLFHRVLIFPLYKCYSCVTILYLHLELYQFYKYQVISLIAHHTLYAVSQWLYVVGSEVTCCCFL